MLAGSGMRDPDSGRTGALHDNIEHPDHKRKQDQIISEEKKSFQSYSVYFSAFTWFL